MKPVSSPTLSCPAMIMEPPRARMSTSEAYMTVWNSGRLRTAPPNVRVEVSASRPFTAPKRCSTHSPRTNAFTARMAVTLSWTTSLSSSMTPCKTRYSGATWRTMSASATASSGSITKNTQARRTESRLARIRPAVNMTGPRIMGLNPFMRAFWITVTSVVMRVTSDDVSKWSRFS